jgi:hypothetical protein
MRTHTHSLSLPSHTYTHTHTHTNTRAAGGQPDRYNNAEVIYMNRKLGAVQGDYDVTVSTHRIIRGAYRNAAGQAEEDEAARALIQRFSLLVRYSQGEEFIPESECCGSLLQRARMCPRSAARLEEIRRRASEEDTSSVDFGLWVPLAFALLCGQLLLMAMYHVLRKHGYLKNLHFNKFARGSLSAILLEDDKREAEDRSGLELASGHYENPLTASPNSPNKNGTSKKKRVVESIATKQLKIQRGYVDEDLDDEGNSRVGSMHMSPFANFSKKKTSNYVESVSQWGKSGGKPQPQSGSKRSKSNKKERRDDPYN